MNTNQPMAGSPSEPNESVAASWLPQSGDDDVFATASASVDGPYAPRSAQRRFRPALSAALLALGLSAGLAGSAWAHQASPSPVATSLAGGTAAATAASVLPANLAGEDDSDAEDGSALPALGNATSSATGSTSVGLTGTATGTTAGAATGG
jgi:hypothetical protein